MKDIKEQQRILGFPTQDHETPRHEADFYRTCPEAVYALLELEDFSGVIWEPACGDGAISEILKERGHLVSSSDLYDYGYGRSGIDFLICDPPPDFKHIITNPPFKLALEFAQRGCELIEKTGGTLALLGRLQFLESIKRKKFFDEWPPMKVWVSSRRLPMMHRAGYAGKKSTSTVAFAWFIWDELTLTGLQPEIGWFDWKDYVSG